jgi:tRNA threonylcarbamoyladenosine modification (KEOPS) complex  Pcc1 subunit
VAKGASSTRRQTEKYKCIITLKTSEAAKYAAALQGGKYKRSTIKITHNASGAAIEILASDATALRASANSVLRDLQVAEASSGI